MCGATDVPGRLITQKLAETFGQQIIVDNRPGAGSAIGSEIVARAQPDGYTLLLTGTPFAVIPALYPKLPFDPAQDFAPVMQVALAPNVLVVHPSLPVRSVKELIALAQAQPGKINYASGGTGGAQHLSGELFSSMANVKLTHIPYKGSAPGLTALIGGETMIGFSDMVITLPHVKSGRLRALAVTGSQRSSLVPDLPTIAESGLAGYSVTAWFGLLAPAATPADIVSRISAEVHKGFATSQMKERFSAMGADPIGNTPEQFAAFLRAEMAKWAKVVKAAGIRGE